MYVYNQNWKKKNPFRPQQMCIIDGAVRVGTDGEIGNLMAIVGQLLLCLPWVSVLLTPFYLAARHYRHLPSSKVPYLPFLYKQTDNTHKHRRERRGNFRRNKRTDHKAKSRKEKGTSHLYKNLPHTHREKQHHKWIVATEEDGYFSCVVIAKSRVVYVVGKKVSWLDKFMCVSPWQKGDTHRGEKKWMIHGIDHDRIQKVLFLLQEKVVSWFVRVASCFMSHPRNPIVPCFFVLFVYDVDVVEMAWVVAQVRLRGLAVSSTAASGRCHRWRRL